MKKVLIAFILIVSCKSKTDKAYEYLQIQQYHLSKQISYADSQMKYTFDILKNSYFFKLEQQESDNVNIYYDSIHYILHK